MHYLAQTVQVNIPTINFNQNICSSTLEIVNQKKGAAAFRFFYFERPFVFSEKKETSGCSEQSLHFVG